MNLHDPPLSHSTCSRTMTSNIGSPCWTAPELMTESATTQYSVKVDVYSFSIICWQLFTGKAPFEEINGSLVALEEAVIAGHRPDIPEHCPDLLKKLMSFGWDPEPMKRPSFDAIVQLIDVELLTLRALDDPHCNGDIDINK